MPRVAAFLLALLAFAAASTAEVSVEFFRFSAGRYVRFAIADTAADLSSVAGPVEGLPVYVADEDALYCYTASAWSACNAGTGSGAPTSAEYVVGALHAGLSAERIGADTVEISWDFGTPGQAKLNLIDDSIAVARLKTSDTPSNGECLTYVSAGDEVGFAACGGGAGSADLAPYGQYDPNNQAASLGTGGWREEWTGDTASETWAWGNQDGATEAIDSDSVLLAGDGTDEFHARCTTAVATNADQTVTAKVWIENLANTNNGAGIGVVVAGTVASPTAIEVLYYQNASTDGYLFIGMTSWALAGASTHGSVETFWPIYSVTQVPTFFQLRYTDSSRNLDAWTSFDGKVFRQIGSSTTISADPVAWCYLVRDDGDAMVEWIQARTDVSRNDAGE